MAITNLHFHRQHVKEFCCSTSSSALVLSVFQIVTILLGVYWYLVVLVCISLITHDVEGIFHLHVFFGKVFVKIFGLFLNRVVFLTFKRFNIFKRLFWYVFYNSPLSVFFPKMFSQFGSYLLILLILYFLEQIFLILMKSDWSIISFIDYVFGIVFIPCARYLIFLLCYTLGA